MILQNFQYIGYIVSICLFIFGLKWLGSPHTARNGNFISALGMCVGVIVTLLHQDIISFRWIVLGVIVGTFIGVVFAVRVAMTAMPEMVALLNGFGGVSSLLVSMGAFLLLPTADVTLVFITIFSVVVGAVTFTGSVVAWGKLSGCIVSRPVSFSGQRLFGIVLGSGLLCLVLMVLFSFYSLYSWGGVVCLSLILGVFFVVSIGGGDMPVVIALLNSFSGIAASFAGMVIGNVVLIIAGLLVGASGFILTVIMCKSMNRSLINVLFGGFGSVSESRSSSQIEGDVNPISASRTKYASSAEIGLTSPSI
jgi:NAD(P) transhydrogenase subunit beta